MLSHSARKYANKGIDLGKNIIVFTNNDYAYEAAIDLKLINNENKVTVVDIRNDSKGDLVKKANTVGIKNLFNQVVTNTKG